MKFVSLVLGAGRGDKNAAEARGRNANTHRLRVVANKGLI